MSSPSQPPVPCRPTPIVTVVVPTYNRAHLLPRALDSALRQSFTSLEVLVVDDGSTDDTDQVMASYLARDPRVRYLRQPQNRGVSAARNQGLREARGEFIAFLDSDDEWFPEKVASQVRRFQELPACVGLVYCGVESVGGRRGDWTFRPEHRGDIFRAMLLRNVIHTGSGVMIRREVVRVVGFFDEEIPAIEDYDYWIRIARHYEADFVPEPLFRYFDEVVTTRKSHNYQDNNDAREHFFRKNEMEMRRVGVAHLFLMESARRHLRGPAYDLRAARRLALAAFRERPTHRPAFLLAVRLFIPEVVRRVLRYVRRGTASARARRENQT